MRYLRLLPMTAVVLATPLSTQLPAQTSVAPAARVAAVQDDVDPDSVCAPFLAQFRDDSGDRAGFGRGAPRVHAVPSQTVAPPPVQEESYDLAQPAPPAAPPPPPPPAHAPMVRAIPPQPPVAYPGPQNRERYAGEPVATVQSVAEAPVSTFSVDVDTGSYANVRRMLAQGQMPPQGAVRTEEMLNYFRYDYPAPRDRTQPFTVSADMTTTPWNPETRLLRVGLRGYDLPRAERPPANLVFLVDVSGSMNEIDKLPLVQCSLALVAERMGPRDRISIVAYAGAAGLVLPPSSNRQEVIKALARLQAGGSTAGGQGIQLAYRTARETMIEGGINRVILATDGDFNVGVTDNEALIDMVERERASGITLTALGYGRGNYNEAMMEQVADHGNGNYAYIDSPREAHKVLGEELSSTLFTIAHDVKIQVEFNPNYVSEYRLIGYENRALAEQDFDNDAVDAGEIGAGHQVTALYEIVPVGARGWRPGRRYPENRAQGQGSANGEMAFLRLRYKLPGQDQSRLIERPLAASLVPGARAPRGDSAFAAAVAAYGQILRGDPWLGTFSFADARRLAAGHTGGDWWRREFVGLTETAERHAVKGAAASGGMR
ncbi:MAG TPA: VWA domain-containing protein [Allosphingosinicella sp.]|jgi:Ca-activated chloride channel family protein